MAELGALGIRVVRVVPLVRFWNTILNARGPPTLVDDGSAGKRTFGLTSKKPMSKCDAGSGS